MNVPKLRFKEFDGEWTNVSLDSIVERVVRKNKQLESKLPLTISADKGLVDQITYFNKNVSGKDLSGYYLLKKGEFAYNKSYSNGYPWGAVKQLENYSQGLLSTLYICFKAMNINEVFLKHYFETNHWHKEVSMIAAEGARNHGLLNIPVNEFFKIKLNIPEEWEQRKIGNLFEKIDKKIQLQQQKIDLLQEQKKGFLQKMFPKAGETQPEIRFDGFIGDWKLEKLGKLVTIHSGWSPSNFEENHSGELFIKVDDLNYSSRVQIESNMKVTSHSKYKKMKKGSIIFPKRGAAIMTNKVRILGKDGYMDTNMMSLEPNGVDNDFLYTFLDKTGLYKIADTSTIPQINNKHIEPYEIMIPELEEQIVIGMFFKKLDISIDVQQKRLELLQKQKQGFMQQMFI
ncbi:restriction endonuclease subunit S [Metalysinibacillus jejuensis]|uniref:restriction endonuclease subunit S n=1 Tax=Metalysinibacillus jejuensis TaxID=914327 RepID=UPI000D39BC72|nr:restriction endonuclease subunit S [Metalysinibacillus jejuensis]